MKVIVLGLAAKGLHAMVPGGHLTTAHHQLHNAPGLLTFQAVNFHIIHAFVHADFYRQCIECAY